MGFKLQMAHGSRSIQPKGERREEEARDLDVLAAHGDHEVAHLERSRGVEDRATIISNVRKKRVDEVTGLPTRVV